MKKIAFTLTLFCLAFNLSAQKQGQGRIDSLVKELQKTYEDTNKVKLLNDLSFSYHNINSEEGIKCGQQALALAEKLKWKKGTAEANGLIGLNYYSKSEYPIAFEYYEIVVLQMHFLLTVLRLLPHNLLIWTLQLNII